MLQIFEVERYSKNMVEVKYEVIRRTKILFYIYRKYLRKDNNLSTIFFEISTKIISFVIDNLSYFANIFAAWHFHLRIN